jgi:hypothetical protein
MKKRTEKKETNLMDPCKCKKKMRRFNQWLIPNQFVAMCPKSNVTIRNQYFYYTHVDQISLMEANLQSNL